MKKRLKLTLGMLLLGGLPAFAAAVSENSESILFYGNSLVERLLEGGELEAYLQLAKPTANLQVRSLAWTGDEVGYRLRPEGYAEHMKSLLEHWPAKTVVVGFGNNESFGGEAGLGQFRKDWETFLKEIRRLHPDATLVLLSPIAVQGGGAMDVRARNKEIQAYSSVIEEIARAHGARFVDLFSASQDTYGRHAEALTTWGIHLNQSGVREMAKVVARGMAGGSVVDSVNGDRVAEIAKAAAQKAEWVGDVVRPKNGVVYFGVRKRPEEYAAEMPRYHQMIEQGDAIIHELVRNPAKKFADFARPSLPPLPEGKSIPDRYSGGILKEPEEQLKDLTVAEGYALNLFASESDFPDLKNPVQISFDARGRLWVVTMPSFPHTLPGEKPNDKILILEDTKHTGKADKCTVFAEGFDALDGVAFHEKGVIVSAQPRLLLLKDTDGDGRADTQEELLRGVDVTDSHHGGMVATDPLGHVIFSDGVFHRSQFETPFGVVRGIDSTTYRMNLGTGRIEIEWQGLTPNPWKTVFDRYGNVFQRFGGGHVLDGLAQGWTPLGVYQPYGNGTTVNYGKGSAASVISSPNFPDKFQQGVASAALLGSYAVTISTPNVDTGTVVGGERIDLLVSQNSAFRPVDTAFGMDGALYVSDFASRIIGHAQHPMRDPQWNHTRGRIWRVISKEKPVVTEWPAIEGATVPELLALLKHGQDLVREHARIELRKKGGEVTAAVDAWVKTLDPKEPGFEQSLLEAVWVLQARDEVRPLMLARLMKSEDPRMRAGAVQVLRFQSANFPEAQAFLKEAAQDPHPRVRMSVLNTLSHLRGNEVSEGAVAGAGAKVGGEGHVTHIRAGSRIDGDKVMEGMNQSEPALQQMVADWKRGTKPGKGRSVPVLEVNPATVVSQWVSLGETETTVESGAVSGGKTAKPNVIKTQMYRTFVEAQTAQTVLLNVKHGYVDISANGVQLLTSDSPYSSQQQVQVDLTPGLNVIEVGFRKLKAKTDHPPVYLCDMVGQPLEEGLRVPHDAEQLSVFVVKWDAAHAAEANALKVQAVPNLMQFAPKELRVKAGQPVRVIFENPDLMQHNLVLVSPGAEEEVGSLADQMAAKPDGFAKNFVPESKKILHATALVNPAGKAELQFTAPNVAGSYPYICTFPGHWRVMKGVLIVE
ncbi:MAG: GDSL-type esterase/lipase family protein [Verrucomicrobiota bacterium]